jgi:hypothetical protein
MTNTKQAAQMFQITKKFTTGTLRGLELQEITGVRFELGQLYVPAFGPAYRVIAIKEIS